ncbi:helix-turn-helix domain-containing protein [Gimibacter soli]|uniref:Helix-turn-helix transcriptional regulator n=1 Tax=Gimibacter soli TaxID=3024400 RepID=A0AAF0BM92_9PROT|nr:helix-turn-helix transcriptional regulator [Gimibacter soli]WCL54240.1 helix-turn-helix transcriptional regulator [Gimibacter soli]
MPDPIDVHVGSRVRMRRTLLGLSQDKLGQALGLTFQQVQKYERGTNRMGASRLLEIARVLDVSPSWFFEDMPEEIAGFGRKGMADEAVEGFEADQGYNRRETLELVRVFYKIEASGVRQRLKDLLDAVADAEQAGAD